ncbi:MAG: prepilin-type N-terminal cleavage/methylation domain-containing protein [Candidatus Coatesbacteria bacterium]|nr:prepilin-type N-terminal cleavage/methylation domain-containing protein [Candidatus Coatesbacteria bacterium]
MTFSGRWRSGFTLLELLIASTITVVIVTMVLAAFQVASKAWAAGERRGDDIQRTRMGLSRLLEDTKSAYPFKVRMFEQQGKTRMTHVLLFAGQPDKISFVTKQGGITGEENCYGLRAVTYYVNDSGSDDETGLIMQEGNPFVEEPFEEGIEYRIDPDITSIAFRYYYDPNIRLRFTQILSNDAGEDPGEWLESWDSYNESSDMGYSVEEAKEIENYLPKAVEVTLTAVREGEEETLGPFIIPIMNRQVSLASGLAEVDEF